MLSKARATVVADYQQRAIPIFPMIDIDEFCDRWAISLMDVSRLCGVDYATIHRARERFRSQGKVNDQIWLKLGLTDLIWRQQSAA